MGRLGVFWGIEHLTNLYFNTPSGTVPKIEEVMDGDPQMVVFASEGSVGGFIFISAPLVETQKIQAVLEQALGSKVTLQRRREVFWFDDLNVALDHVEGLGDFV